MEFDSLKYFLERVQRSSYSTSAYADFAMASSCTAIIIDTSLNSATAARGSSECKGSIYVRQLNLPAIGGVHAGGRSRCDAMQSTLRHTAWPTGEATSTEQCRWSSGERSEYCGRKAPRVLAHRVPTAVRRCYYQHCASRKNRPLNGPRH